MPASIRTVNDHFSQLLRRARLGEEIVVTSHGKPVAKLVPVSPEDIGQVPSRRRLLEELENLRDSLHGRCSGLPLSESVTNRRKESRY
ncbi:MAG: type II toxin-antitoxin system Phd/YefM family antitoxin [Deferrisomatales bacterium]